MPHPITASGSLEELLAKWHTIGFAGRLRMSPVREEADDAVAEIALDDTDHNPGGAVHGGVAFGLIDTLMGYVVNKSTEGKAMVGTVSQTIDFLAVPKGTLIGRARIDRMGGRTAFVSGEAHDTEGNLVARSSAVWAIRRSDK
ncbi:MAG: PaaI family thioesterase, partial [Euryarchaeota archaeon]|nr:PaaI family thioesterase [Euryarchaeota archaeon]